MALNLSQLNSTEKELLEKVIATFSPQEREQFERFAAEKEDFTSRYAKILVQKEEALVSGDKSKLEELAAKEKELLDLFKE